MNKNVFSIIQEARRAFKADFGLSGKSKDKKRRRAQAIKWRLRKRILRDPVEKIDCITDPLTGIMIGVSVSCGGKMVCEIMQSAGDLKFSEPLLKHENS